MIPSRPERQPHLSLQVVAAGLLLLLSGCMVGERESTLMRSRRAREAGRMRAERLEQERELEVWQATRDEALTQIAEAKAASVASSSQLRSVRAQLLRELEALRATEQDLEQAKLRAKEIEKELQPLRAKEQLIRDQQKLIEAAQAKLSKTKADVDAIENAVKQQHAALAPRMEALRKRHAALKSAGVQIAEVEAKIAAAQKAFDQGKPAPKKAAPKPAPKKK